MAHRGHLDGLMRHGAFSGAGLSGRQPLEPSPATILEILENKLAVQTAEAEKLIRENQRLADSHAALRKDIIDTETEMQMIRTHLGDVQVETDMHMRDLVERIRLMEADIQAGDAVKKELHQVHMEAKRLITERQMLTNDLEAATKELQKYSGDNSNLTELVAELDGLRKEHHSLRSAFEYEKNTNIKQVEQMRTMEMNLITMTKEADKLRADLANAANRAHAAQVTPPQPGTGQAAAASAATNPYASAYTSHPSAYQQGTSQAAAYQQGTAQAAAYQQGTPQSAAYQQGTPQSAAYQQGAPQSAAYQQGAPQSAAYQQGAPQAGAYQQGTYGYPTAYDSATAYQLHANAYASYSGYPVAGYAQPSYPGTYAAPQQHPVASGAATDTTSVYGAAGSTGYPAAPVQASSGAANAGQAAPPASYPATYDPTKAAQR
ncbi:protein FLX-like 1 isoform X1 [Triticum dicoccoides]|uniref:protein FLX-like 1 isoform X1 n=1 Tax=Triticum dicoccoides TaxID=85692 RepID=UPI001890DBB6|nr:protein FLX-like 1 isoform X1 [Triticum dicoccoides]XP_037448639.1 protein FLX-like 1 isoform X1 [Triticum dicoccoides]